MKRNPLLDHDFGVAVQEVEKELNWKTRQLQDYVENAAVGLHWVDENGMIKWANKAELDMLGYQEEEYIGHHISEFHINQEKIDDILKRLSCNETLDQYESELRCKDGSVKIVHISSNVFWEDGKFVHTRCFTIDVTEQRKLFTALKESEARYKNLINSLPAPLYTTDADGAITMYNQAAADLWGREPEIGRDLWCGSYKILNADGSPLSLDECPMAICLKEKRPVYGAEIIVVRPDGSLRNMAPHPQPLYDSGGNMIGAINMLIDITGAKATEKALRENENEFRKLAATLEKKVEEKTRDLKKKNEELKESEERYHKMIEEVEDYAIILLDQNGIIQNWNKGAEKIKGYKEEEIVGRSFTNFYFPEDQKSGLPLRLMAEARHKGKAIHEGWRKKKDGTRFWGSIVLTALHDADYKVIGFSKVTRDLTERKLAEDRLKEYSNQLEFQNQELEQFAFAASHDMKEPLRKIHMYSSAILEDASSQLSEKASEYLKRSIVATKRMSGLIEDLLTYSQTAASLDHYEQVDISKIVDEISQDHKDDFEQTHVTLHAENLPVVYGISFQLKQLMDNIIGNAVKYKHPGRDAVITIRSSIVKGSQIKVGDIERDKKYYKISVADNGVGFDQRHAEKIFDIFQRLHNLPAASGSGIGLAICKRIAQNHKGAITAEGKPGEGACFHIYLPTES